MPAADFYRILGALTRRPVTTAPRNVGAVPPAFIERNARQGVEL